jgi:hypothetical protein
MVKHRMNVRRTAAFIGTLVVAATVAFGGVMHAQADVVDDSAAIVAEMQARSAAIPQQPAADPETGKPVQVSGGVTIFNEPVWTRTCDRGQGMELWNRLDPKDCAGTMTYYYYNVKKAKFNMVRYLASQPRNRHGNPSALLRALDDWCGDHAFQCELLVGVALLPAATLFSGPS